MTPSVQAVATAASESARDAVVGEAASPDKMPPAAAATEADAATDAGANTGCGAGTTCGTVLDSVGRVGDGDKDFVTVISRGDFDSEVVVVANAVWLREAVAFVSVGLEVRVSVMLEVSVCLLGEFVGVGNEEVDD